RYQIATKLTITRFHRGDPSTRRRRHWRDANRPMGFMDLSFVVNRLHRLLTSVSVRSRIVVLALIPVVGFLANGLTYVSGEGDVGTAFDTVNQSAGLAD